MNELYTVHQWGTVYTARGAMFGIKGTIAGLCKADVVQQHLAARKRPGEWLQVIDAAGNRVPLMTFFP